jgi:hypothetical protein
MNPLARLNQQYIRWKMARWIEQQDPDRSQPVQRQLDL